VAFQPDPNDPEKATTRIATCGGPYVVLIDVTSGKVIWRHKDENTR
jgi:hypothetical protein